MSSEVEGERMTIEIDGAITARMQTWCPELESKILKTGSDVVGDYRIEHDMLGSDETAY